MIHHYMQQKSVNPVVSQFEMPVKELIDLNIKALQSISYIMPTELMLMRRPEEMIEKNMEVLMENSHTVIAYMQNMFHIMERHMMQGIDSSTKNFKDISAMTSMMTPEHKFSTNKMTQPIKKTIGVTKSATAVKKASSTKSANPAKKTTGSKSSSTTKAVLSTKSTSVVKKKSGIKSPSVVTKATSTKSLTGSAKSATTKPSNTTKMTSSTMSKATTSSVKSVSGSTKRSSSATKASSAAMPKMQAPIAKSSPQMANSASMSHNMKTASGMTSSSLTNGSSHHSSPTQSRPMMKELDVHKKI